MELIDMQAVRRFSTGQGKKGTGFQRSARALTAAVVNEPAQ